MRLVLERRPDSSGLLAIVSPLIAVALTLAASAAMFAFLGMDPLRGIAVFFLDPLADGWALQELAVKATPLVLIAVGLSLCYLSNNWNIGAEGQYTAGAMLGGWLALLTHGTGAGWWVFPAMAVLGMIGGAAWALIPAGLKVKFGASEILTSLMLVYVADLALDYLTRGPWRDPKGYNFPTSVAFEPSASVPLLFGEGRLHIGFVITLIVVGIAAMILGHTIKGFEIRLIGEAPRAGRFGGFDDKRLTLLVFAISGALAGLAGLIEVAGPIGQLQPAISPGYGFTAIIVAFLGRLNPIGILISGAFLALTFIGAENAQIVLRVPLDVTRVFQGLLLVFVLACDSFVLHRVRIVRTEAAP